MVPNEVRMVGVHVGQLHLDHQLDVLLALLLLLAQETHEQTFHLIAQTRVAVHLERKGEAETVTVFEPMQHNFLEGR